jgi:hypothetical protein
MEAGLRLQKMTVVAGMLVSLDSKGVVVVMDFYLA